MKTFMLLMTIALTNFTVLAQAADPVAPQEMSKMKKKLSVEELEKMATAHTKMAACLRTNKDFTQCRDALRKENQAMMGEFCSGMGMDKEMHKGMEYKK